ncbi:MAG: hypothetical protein KC502_08840 [Myxococcales bacterium]|nr:hypothetical protein [Myxococcales bacterium]
MEVRSPTHGSGTASPGLSPTKLRLRRRALALPVGLFLLALAMIVAGCGDSEVAAPWLERVVVPADIRVGTPVIAIGDGLRGLSLQLTGPAGELRVALDSRPDGGVRPGVTAVIDSPWTHGHVLSPVGTLQEGDAFTRACVTNASVGGATRQCVAITAGRWRPGPMVGGVPMLSPQTQPIFGHLLEIHGAQVPLPGEGTATLEVQLQRAGHADAAHLVGVIPVDPNGDTGLSVLVRPSWLGAFPGARTIRIRLHRSVVGGDDTTDWSPWIKVTPSLPPLEPDDSLVTRGEPIAWARIASNWPQLWREGPSLEIPGLVLELDGQWRDAAGAVAATWKLETPNPVHLHVAGPVKPAAVLDSSAWFQHGWAAMGDHRFVGHARWTLKGKAGHLYRGPSQDVSFQLKRTVQSVVIVTSSSTRAGLARFGLAALDQQVTERVLAIVQSHFAAWSVDVTQTTDSAPQTSGERVRVVLLDRDPNGFGLLGNDPSVGKDIGNKRLAEQLDGRLHRPGRVAGQPPYGGVFIAGFLSMSAQLNPSGVVASPAFDLIFAPFAPELGGTAVANSNASAAASAVEALAQLIAGTVSHEVGHTLGLASAEGYHHPTDNPGWRMDAGTARPFVERANLSDSGGEHWGELDAAYLTKILPKSP